MTFAIYVSIDGLEQKLKREFEDVEDASKFASSFPEEVGVEIVCQHDREYYDKNKNLICGKCFEILRSREDEVYESEGDR